MLSPLLNRNNLLLQFTHHMYSNIDHACMRKYLDT